MENKQPNNEIETKKDIEKSEKASSDKSQPEQVMKEVTKVVGESEPDALVKVNPVKSDKTESSSIKKEDAPKIPKNSAKPPKIEDKPFEEFISNYFIPGLKSSIEEKGTSVSEIKLIEGNRPVVGGNCWIVFCEITEQRRFWLCFNEDKITSDKTILLAESNSDPSIVESFLIDEKKTTLPLLISRILQRLNGQKWFGAN